MYCFLLPHALQERDRLVPGNPHACGCAPAVFVRVFVAAEPVSSECLASLFGNVAGQVLLSNLYKLFTL